MCREQGKTDWRQGSIDAVCDEGASAAVVADDADYAQWRRTYKRPCARLMNSASVLRRSYTPRSSCPLSNAFDMTSTLHNT